jgi:hypothetical protein
MIEAPSLEYVISHIRETRNPMRGILLAPKFDKIGMDEIIPRFSYLEYRTSDKINFYCAGYGGYWNDELFPDMEKLKTFKYKDGSSIPWAFSQTEFAKFIDELESKTSWRYSGGTELIILDENADFSNAITFNIEKMITSKVLANSAELFEALIQRSRNSKNSITGFSSSSFGKHTSEAFVESLIELLPKGIKPLKGIWIKGQHYFLNDLTKERGHSKRSWITGRPK